MARRKIEETGNHARLVKVHKDSDTGEYVCSLYINGKRHGVADYFTDCLDDAQETARAMAGEIIKAVSVSGYSDNRAVDEKGLGGNIPMVHLMQSGDNAYNLDSIGMTPAQAKRVAVEMIKAAIVAESGRDYEREEIDAS